MKKRFAILLFAVLALGLCVPPVFAQASGTAKGVCKDAQGNPIVDGVVVWTNMDNGQKYALKTNKKGEYFSLGLSPGKYNVTLYKSADDMKAGKELFHQNGFPVQLDENTLDFDLKKEQENSAKGQGLTPEQVKQMQEQQAKAHNLGFSHGDERGDNLNETFLRACSYHFIESLVVFGAAIRVAGTVGFNRANVHLLCA